MGMKRICDKGTLHMLRNNKAARARQAQEQGQAYHAGSRHPATDCPTCFMCHGCLEVLPWKVGRLSPNRGTNPAGRGELDSWGRGAGGGGTSGAGALRSACCASCTPATPRVGGRTALLLMAVDAALTAAAAAAAAVAALLPGRATVWCMPAALPPNCSCWAVACRRWLLLLLLLLGAPAPPACCCCCCCGGACCAGSGGAGHGIASPRAAAAAVSGACCGRWEPRGKDDAAVAPPLPPIWAGRVMWCACCTGPWAAARAAATLAQGAGRVTGLPPAAAADTAAGPARVRAGCPAVLAPRAPAAGPGLLAAGCCFSSGACLAGGALGCVRGGVIAGAMGRAAGLGGALTTALPAACLGGTGTGTGTAAVAVAGLLPAAAVPLSARAAGAGAASSAAFRSKPCRCGCGCSLPPAQLLCGTA